MPSGQTPLQSFPYPVPGDAVNVENDIAALATAMDAHGPLSFASGAERQSKLPSPADATLTFLRDARTWEWWDGAQGVWRYLSQTSNFYQLANDNFSVANNQGNIIVTGWSVESASAAFQLQGDGTVRCQIPMTVIARLEADSDATTSGNSNLVLGFSNLGRVMQVGGVRDSGYAGAGTLRQAVTSPPVFCQPGTIIHCNIFQANLGGIALPYTVVLQLATIG